MREALTRLRGCSEVPPRCFAFPVPDLVAVVSDVLQRHGLVQLSNPAPRERCASGGSLGGSCRVSAGVRWAHLAEFVEQLDERARPPSPRSQTVSRWLLSTQPRAWSGRSYSVIGCSDGLIPLQHADTPERQLEEERRLLYVAITRAERDLTLVWARSRQPGGRTHSINVAASWTSFAQATAPADGSAVQRGSRSVRCSSSQRRKRRGPASVSDLRESLVTSGGANHWEMSQLSIHLR